MANKQTKKVNASIKTATLTLTGMSCGGCINMVTGLLKSVKGVKTMKVTFTPQRAVVQYDSTVTNPAALASAIKKGGYGATVAKTVVKVAAKKKHKCGAGCKCKSCQAKKGKAHKCPAKCKCKACLAKKAKKKVKKAKQS